VLAFFVQHFYTPIARPALDQPLAARNSRNWVVAVGETATIQPFLQVVMTVNTHQALQQILSGHAITPQQIQLSVDGGSDFLPKGALQYSEKNACKHHVFYLNFRMKIETTISLEPELLQSLTRFLGTNDHRSLSELIEEALRRFLATEKQKTYDTHELELINRNADRLNQEAGDVLTYQMEL
jgi:hypothetical protein